MVDIWWIKSQLTACALIGLFFGWTCGCSNKSLVGLFKTLKKNPHFDSGTFKTFLISYPITGISDLFAFITVQSEGSAISAS